MVAAETIVRERSREVTETRGAMKERRTRSGSLCIELMVSVYGAAGDEGVRARGCYHSVTGREVERNQKRELQ